MFRSIFLTFGIILLFLFASAQSTDYAIEKYTIKNGLPSGRIEIILQDHLGFIWIGTSNGLVKYDGYTFFTYKNNYNNNHSLANNIITGLYESPDNILFIATRGGLHIYNRNNDNFDRIPANNSIGFTNSFTARSMCSDNKGNHYITSFDNKGIFRLTIDKKTNKVTVTPFQYPSACTNNFCVTKFDSKGRLWFMSRFDILCYEKGTVKRIQFPPSKSYIYINTIAISPNGTLFIATNKGMYYYNEAENTIKTLNLQFESVKNEDLNISEVYFSKDGKIYFAAENQGVFIVDKTGKQIEHYFHTIQNDNSIGNNSINAMYVDKNNNIWLGTIQNDLNVLLLKPKYFEKHIYASKGKNNGLQSNLINCYYEEGKSMLWLGTDGGGIQKYNIATNTFTNVGNGVLKSNKIINLVGDSYQHVWICTYGGGLAMYNLQTSTLQNIPLLSRGKEVENVYDAKMISPTILLVASLGQGLITYNIQTNQSTSIDSLLWKNKYIRINQFLSNIVIDKQSHIWISSQGEGVYECNKNLQLIDHLDSNIPNCIFSNNIVTSLSVSKNGKLWIGTYDGLNIIDLQTKKIQIIKENDGLASNIITNVSCIDNNAWVCTNDGISKINTKTLSIENLGETDGLWTSNSKYGFVSELHNGKLLVAGDYGCMIFNKDSIKNRLLDLNFTITNIKANGESIGYGTNNTIDLAYFQNNVSIEFVSLAHNYSSQIVYEYSLNDNKWIYLGNKHELLFPNMTNGKYSIKLKAYIIGKEKQARIINLYIIIHPPYWKTWWFLTLCFIIIIATIVFIVYQRLQSLKKQSFLLEQKVFERTQQILTQKDELSNQFTKLTQINDELVRTNSEQTKIFEIVSQKSKYSENEATSPKSNEEKTLQKAIDYINEHINDETLTVESLSSHANYSSVQLYRIIKTLTELTPNDLIKTIRLQKAKEMLITGKYSVSDVCYQVGFHDPKYFSKCFKDYYTVLPSDCIPK